MRIPVNLRLQCRRAALFGLLALGLLLSPGRTLAATTEVANQGDLQTAINTAVDLVQLTVPNLALTVTITASGDAPALQGQTGGTTISGADGQRIFNINGDLESISNLVLEHDGASAPVSGTGGAVNVAGSITGGIHDSEFNNNSSTGNGSAVYVGGNFDGGISGSSFDGNATGGAGAVYVGGFFTGGISDTTFSNNSYSGSANTPSSGGIVIDKTFSGGISNSHFINNSGMGNNGGGFTVLANNSLTTGDNKAAAFVGDITDSTFIDNKNTRTVSGLGGGLGIAGRLNGNIVNTRFEGNEASSTGGGLYTYGVTGGVFDSKFINNTAGQYGGGIYITSNNDSPGLAGGVHDSLFQGNNAGNGVSGMFAGGAIYVGGVQIFGGIHNTQFIDNSASVQGGAVVAMEINGGIHDSLFLRNKVVDHASGQGGAVLTAASVGATIPQTKDFNGDITNTNFIENEAANLGSAILIGNDFTGDIVDSEFRDNVVHTGPATVYVANIFTGDIIRTTFIGNRGGIAQNRYGGAGFVAVMGHAGDITASRFEDNQGGTVAGGAFAVIQNDFDGSIKDSFFIDNLLETATAGSYANLSNGGAVGVMSGVITGSIENTEFSGNSTTGSQGQGGAVYASAIQGGILGSTFSGNSSGYGGALALRGAPELNIESSSFSGNSALSNGGAIYRGSGDLNLKNTDFRQNTAASGQGGAIYTSGRIKLEIPENMTTTFAGNTAGGTPNSVWFQNSGALEVQAYIGAVLDMLDPLAGNAADGQNLAIDKSGAGVWKLGGANTFTADGSGSVNFNVNQGELHLYGAGEIANPTAADNTAQVQAGSLDLAGADSSFSLGDGSNAARLRLGGQNSITAANIHLKNGSQFLAGSNGAAGSYGLALNSSLSDLDGSLEIRAEAGQSLNLDASLEDAATASAGGQVSKTGQGDLNLLRVDTFAGISSFNLAAGKVATSQDQTFQEFLLPEQSELDMGGADLRLASGLIRGNLNNAKNLTKYDSGQLDIYTPIRLSEDFTVSGGSVGMYISMHQPHVYARKAAFAAGTNLDVIGYDGTGRGDSSVIIETSDVLNAEDMPPAYTIAGNDALTADFLSVQLQRGPEDKSIVAITDLRWYDQSMSGADYDQAHGRFTLDNPDGSFELGSLLEDRDGTFTQGWDGKTLTKNGDGTLVLTATNTYSGGTIVNAGTLVAAVEGALGSGHTVLESGAKLVILHDGVFTTEVHGGGIVEINGNMYVDCDESLHTGQVHLNGSLGLAMDRTRNVTSGAAFHMAEGSRLYGNGAIGNLNMASGSTIAPGHSLGTIRVNGNAVFAAGSVYEVEVDPANPGSSDRIEVTGTADLGGATVVQTGLGGESDYVQTGEWTILSAAGGYGTSRFAPQVEGELVFLDQELLYPNPNDVVLRIERNQVEPEDFAGTPNQMAVAGALNSLQGSGASLYDALMSVPAGTDLADLYDQLSGELHASVQGALQNYDRQFGRTLRSRLVHYDRPLEGGFPLWFSVDGYAAESDGKNGTADARHSGLNVTIGAETLLDEQWLAGAAFRYGRSEIKAKGRHSKADVDSFTLGLYAGRQFAFEAGDLRWSLGASYGLHRLDTEREIQLEVLRQDLDVDYTAQTAQFGTELGFSFPLGGSFNLEPYAGVAWNSVWVESFKESGGNAALAAESEHQGNFSHALGLRGTAKLDERVNLELDASWLHLYGDLDTDNNFRFREGGDKFEIIGAALPRDAAALRLGLAIRATNRLGIYLGYDGLLGERIQSHGGNLTMKYSF